MHIWTMCWFIMYTYRWWSSSLCKLGTLLHFSCYIFAPGCSLVGSNRLQMVSIHEDWPKKSAPRYPCPDFPGGHLSLQCHWSSPVAIQSFLEVTIFPSLQCALTDDGVLHYESLALSCMPYAISSPMGCSSVGSDRLRWSPTFINLHVSP